MFWSSLLCSKPVTFIHQWISLVWAKLFKNFSKKTRVKLVAIAKDEAAYLPDWIFHHLFVGFNEVSIYLNNITDNSYRLSEALKAHSQVKFINGDRFFKQGSRAPQLAIYLHELCMSRWQGYSHVMFLDIDEFLLSKNVLFDINSFVKNLNCDVCCFEWVHKMDENIPFGKPLNSEILGRHARQVKSIISTNLSVKHLTPHNIYNNNAKYQLSNGKKVSFKRVNYTKVDNDELSKPIKDIFVLHRMVRHEVEYVAALKRGRPITENKKCSIFKDNRGGGFTNAKNELVLLSIDNLATYEVKKSMFFQKFNIEKIIEEGQSLVLTRFEDVLKMIENAPISELKTLEKILKNIENERVNQAFQIFLRKHKLSNE